jgi:hypothetical protein
MMGFKSLGFCILISCVSLVASGHLSAHSQESKDAARKFDGYGDLNCEDAKARLDALAIELMREPEAQAFLIVYRGRKLPGRAIPLYVLKDYLTDFRGIDPSRVFMLDGGEREGMAVEEWIVPEGAAPPIPTPQYQVEIENSPVPLKFNEGWADVSTVEGKPSIQDYDDCSFRALDLKEFANALRAAPDSQAYIIIYTAFDRGALRAQQVANIARTELIGEERIAETRITSVYGGHREYPAMELWLVPAGAPLPKPTPERKKKEGRRN